MKFINGTNRNQLPLFASSIDDAIAQDNEIRLIDLFVDSIKLADFGFTFDFVENGRPAYHPSDLLKLFIYGYLNRMRQSRTLEKECNRNIEFMWLLKGLVPDHNTIANFRKNNPKAIARVFRATVKLATHFELIGGSLVAYDSTKLRAQNSHRRILNLIDHNLLKQYLKVLDLYFGTLRAIFKAFYALFSFEKVKVAFFKKNFNCSLNHIYLLTD